MTHIRRLASTDLYGVCALEQAAGDVGWTRAHFEKELESEISRVWVMEDNGRICAYGGYWKAADEAQITNLLVAPGFRCRGYGAWLLGWLMDEARRDGCTQMTLEVRSTNIHARRLYEKHGFAETARRPKFYADPVSDAILMERIL